MANAKRRCKRQRKTYMAYKTMKLKAREKNLHFVSKPHTHTHTHTHIHTHTHGEMIVIMCLAHTFSQHAVTSVDGIHDTK